MHKFSLISQNSMASFIFTLIFVKQNSQKINALYCFQIVSGEKISSKLGNLNRLISNSSIKFALYKLAETHVFINLLNILKTITNLKYSSIKDIANAHNIPYFQFQDVNDKNFIAHINNQKGNQFAVFTTGQIVRKSTLKEFKNYPINCHGSLLPEMRGPAQYIWYHVQNYEYYGITFNNLQYELDSGDILYQNKFKIPKNISCFYLHYLIAQKWGTEFKNLNNSLHFPPDSIKQTNLNSSTVSLPDTNAFRQLKTRNIKVIKLSDFSKIISDIRKLN